MFDELSFRRASGRWSRCFASLGRCGLRSGNPGAQIDPQLHQRDGFFGELGGLERHCRLFLMGDKLIEQARLGIAGCDCRPASSSAKQGVSRRQVEPSLLQFSRVATSGSVLRRAVARAGRRADWRVLRKVASAVLRLPRPHQAANWAACQTVRKPNASGSVLRRFIIALLPKRLALSGADLVADREAARPIKT